MPKDPTKNIDRYKIRGGTLNEFEFDQNQEAYAAQQAQQDAKLIPGTPPEEKTTSKAAKKPAKATKSTKTKTVATRGASAKKLAARKAAKK